MRLPVNLEQVARALTPADWMAREDAAAGTVEIEAANLTSAELQSKLSGVVYDAAVKDGQATIRDRAQQALATNAAFLALASPTNAQTVTQVKALTRECNALIRMALNLLDDTTGT